MKPGVFESGVAFSPDAYVPTPAAPPPSEADAKKSAADAAERINVVSPDGQAFSVERHELELVKKQGFHEETHEQEALRSYGEENKDWNSNGAIRLAVGNVVKGGTFGLIDPNHSDWDPYENAKTELIRAQHPGANIAGHIGGFAAGLVTGAPLFGAASVAGGGVKAAILGGEGVAAGLGRTLLAHAVGAGTEGALISVPNAIKEAAFGDPERAGETLLYGFGAGATLGLAGGLTSKIAGKMAGKQSALGEALGASSEAVSSEGIKKPGGVIDWLKSYAENHAEAGSIAKDAIAAKAETAATSAASRYAGNAVGGIIGHTIGGPIGGFAGSAVGGMVADKIKETAPALLAKGAKLVAERLEGGPGIAGITQAFASAGEKLDAIPSILANLGKKGAHAVASYDELPQHVMSEFAGGKASPGTTQHERFENLSKEITALSSDPERLSATLAKVTEPFAKDAPDIATQYGVKATQALRYLADTMPKAPTVQTPFSPPPNWKPTDAELADFARRVHTVQDPFSALQRLKDKTIGAADVETLKAVYPKVYETMLSRIMAYGASPDVKPLDYQYRIKLALLTGAPLDPSLTNIAELQSTFSQQEAPKGMGSMPKPSSPKTNTSRLATPVERISNK